MSNNIIHIETPMFNGELKIVLGFYNNGRTALQLVDVEDGSPYYIATVNIPEEELAEGCVFLKGWSENEGVPEALEKAGVVKLTGRIVASGWVEAQEGQLLI